MTQSLSNQSNQFENKELSQDTTESNAFLDKRFDEAMSLQTPEKQREVADAIDAVEAKKQQELVASVLETHVAVDTLKLDVEDINPPKFEGAPELDSAPGFSQKEFKQLEEFMTKLDDPLEKRKIRLELKASQYEELKNLLYFVDQQFGFQFLMMDEVDADSEVQPDGYDDKVNFYDTYKNLMTKLLGAEAVKSVAELEASAQSDMSSFVEKQYTILETSNAPTDQYVDFFDIVGKYAQEVQYTSAAGSDGGYKVSASSLNAFKVLQQQLKKAPSFGMEDATTVESGPIKISKETEQLKDLIVGASGPAEVMQAVSRFRFLRALDTFAQSVDDKAMSLDDKKNTLRVLSKKLQYITDINVTLSDGTTQAKDFLSQKLLALAKQEEVIKDASFSKDIDNFLDDLTYESHAYGLAMTVEDGVDHAEILWSAEQVAKGKRIEYLGYLDYTENIKRLDSGERTEGLVIDQIGEYFVASELDLSRLSYLDKQSAEQLVGAINQNSHIESVTLNLMLMKERLGDEALVAVLDQLQHLNKEVTVIVGRDGLGYDGIGFTRPLLSKLATPTSSIPALTVLTDGMQSEYDLMTLTSFAGSLSLPRLIDTPLDDASTQSFVKEWSAAHPSHTLELGFIKTSNVLPEAIDQHGSKGQTYKLSRLQELQVDGGSPLSYTQANVSLPSQTDIPNDLLAIGDSETKTSVDIGEAKEKKKRRIDVSAGEYDFAGMSIDTQKARDIRTYFRGNALTIQKPSDDKDLLELAQAKNLTRLQLVGSSAPSSKTLLELEDKGYIDNIGLQGIDVTSLATAEYMQSLDGYEQLTVSSGTTTKPTPEQWKELMQFDGRLTIDQPLSLDLQALGDALEESQPTSLVLRNRKELIIKDDQGNDKTLTPDDYYKSRDSYAVGKKDKQGYDLVDFFNVLKKHNVQIDFADGADQFPAILYQQYLAQ